MQASAIPQETIRALMQGIGQRARIAARIMARASTAQKNQALTEIANAIRQQAPAIFTANRLDIARAQKNGHNAAFQA